MIFLKSSTDIDVIQTTRNKLMSLVAVDGLKTRYRFLVRADSLNALKAQTSTIRVSVYASKPMNVVTTTFSPVLGGANIAIRSSGSFGIENFNQNAAFNAGSSAKLSGFVASMTSLGLPREIDSGGMSSDSLVTNILMSSARRRNYLMNNSALVMSRKSVDITSKINNQVASFLASKFSKTLSLSGTRKDFAKNADSDKRFDVASVVRKRRTVRLVRVGDLTAQGINYPVHNIDFIKPPQNDLKSINPYRMIYDHAVDPSLVSVRAKFAVPAMSAIGGMSNNGQLSQHNVVKRNSSLLLRNSPSSMIMPKNSFDLNPQSYVPVITREKETICELPVEFDVNEKDLPSTSRFHVVMEAISNVTSKNPSSGRMTERSAVVQMLMHEIPHAEFKQSKSIPTLAPSILISKASKPGYVMIQLQQNDKVATSIRLFRKRITFDIDDDSGYEFIKDLDAVVGDGKIMFFDEGVHNGVPLSYRAIAVNAAGEQSFEFSNAIASPPTWKRNAQSIMKRDLQCSIVPQTSLLGISVEIYTIPIDVVSIALYRKDLSTNETYSLVKNTNAVSLSFGASSISFIDADVKEFHIYEYVCRFTFRDGVSVFSTSIAQTEYVKFSQSLAPAFISKLSTDISDVSKSSVRFQLHTGSIVKQDDKILGKLRELKNDTLYETEIANNREKLQNIVSHKISRIDLKTGIEEHLGEYSGKFFSEKTKLSSLKRGRTYKYVIKSASRHPDTLLENTIRSEKVTKNSSVTYQLNVAKFRHPQVLRDGTLLNSVNSAFESTRFSKDKFAFGVTGEVTTVDAHVPDVSTHVSNVSAVLQDDDTALLTWSVTGDVSKIDHFVVLIDNLGIEKIAGKVNVQQNGSTFRFIDTFSGERGNIAYYVVPVDNRYRYGSRSKSNELMIDFG